MAEATAASNETKVGNNNNKDEKNTGPNGTIFINRPCTNSNNRHRHHNDDDHHEPAQHTMIREREGDWERVPASLVVPHSDNNATTTTQQQILVRHSTTSRRTEAGHHHHSMVLYGRPPTWTCNVYNPSTLGHPSRFLTCIVSRLVCTKHSYPLERDKRKGTVLPLRIANSALTSFGGPLSFSSFLHDRFLPFMFLDCNPGAIQKETSLSLIVESRTNGCLVHQTEKNHSG